MATQQPTTEHTTNTPQAGPLPSTTATGQASPQATTANGLRLTFFGVQGSIPAPNTPEDIETKIAKALVRVHESGGLPAVLEGREATVANIREFYFATQPAAAKTIYGRDTSCAEVRTSDGKLIILDAGTGLRKLGNKLMREMPLDATLLISHVHWDHIQGFPFFTPVYVPGNRFTVYGVTKDDIETGATASSRSGSGAGRDSEALKRCFETQMGDYFFPVHLGNLGSRFAFKTATAGEIQVGDARVTTCFVNHPDPNVAYRIEDSGKAIVYATDHEHYVPGEAIDHSSFPNFRRDAHANLERFAAGADVLIYDGQYTPEEYNPAAFGQKGMAKIGWGHSTYKHGIDLSLNAGVKKLVITHHDPSHSDDKLDEIKHAARAYLGEQLAKRGMSPNALSLVLSYEGMEVRP